MKPGRRPWRSGLVGLCLNAALQAWAQVPAAALAPAASQAGAGAPTADLAAEREAVLRRQAEVEARFVEKQRACQSRFAVTDCVNDAKKLRREALVPLRRQGIAVDEALRKDRAARRLEDIRNKTAAQALEREVVVRRPAPAASAGAAEEPAAAAAAASGAAPSATEAPASPVGAVPALQTRQPPSPKRLLPKPSASARPSEAQRRATEAERQAQIESRQREAREHREAVERRNAQRALSGKRASPLPVPGATSPVPLSAQTPASAVGK